MGQGRGSLQIRWQQIEGDFDKWERVLSGQQKQKDAVPEGVERADLHESHKGGES